MPVYETVFIARQDLTDTLTIRLDEATDGPSIMMDSGKYDKKDDSKNEKEAA